MRNSKVRRERMRISPFPFCEPFEIHGSKFKLHPVLNLRQATVRSITHLVFFFCIGENSFDGFFSPFIQFFVLRRVPYVVCQLLEIFPYMSGYRFDAVFGMGAKLSCWTISADSRVTFLFAVSITVCCTVL